MCVGHGLVKHSQHVLEEDTHLFRAFGCVKVLGGVLVLPEDAILFSAGNKLDQSLHNFSDGHVWGGRGKSDTSG